MRADPSTLGTSGHDRIPLDHYVTPERTVNSLISIIEDDLPSWSVWEPMCGDGAFSKLLAPLAREIVSTDIREYPGFTPDAVLDFLSVKTDEEYTELAKTLPADQIKRFTPMSEVGLLKGARPDVIISNPPYGDDAETFLWHALKLMQPETGIVIFLCRHEWDCAKGRKGLFTHPAFSGKIVLHHRPRWIKDSTGAPRHNYAYYIFDWSKALNAPKAKPELMYAD